MIARLCDVSTVACASHWDGVAVSELNIDVGLDGDSGLDEERLRSKGPTLLSDIAGNFVEEGGCVSFCNSHEDVTDCVGFSEVSFEDGMGVIGGLLEVLGD